jgi:hypothetical protein
MIKEDEVGEAYSPNGRKREMDISYWWESQREIDHWKTKT